MQAVIKPALALWRVLERGMSGHDVAAWQTVLSLSTIGFRIDGQFGKATEDLTKDYQRAKGLADVDGVVGPLTRATIPAELFADTAAVPAPLPDGLPLIRFVQAKVWRATNRTAVDWIVMHSAEVWEKPSSAEAVAAYFLNPKPDASAHYVVDCDSIVQCVKTEHQAAHCNAGNARSIGIEQAGYAKQTRAEWLDEYGMRLLTLAGRLVARDAKKWAIPLVKLTPADIQAGRRGICGHKDINDALGSKTGHWDPGPGYPWDVLLGIAKAA